MKNRMINVVNNIFLLFFSFGIILSNVVFESLLINNIFFLFRLIGIVGLIFSFGYNYSLSKEKNAIFLNYIKIYYIIFVLVTFINITDFKKDFLFKVMSFVTYLSPIVKSTYNLNFEAFLVPSYIIIMSFLHLLADKQKLFKSNKSIMLLFIINIFLCLFYGFISYNKNYYIVDDKFINIFNPFNVLLIYLTGCLVNKYNIKKIIKKKYLVIIELLIISFFGFICLKSILLECRLRVYLLTYLVLIFIAFFRYLFDKDKIDYSYLFIMLFVFPVINGIITKINIDNKIKIIIYLIISIILLIIFVIDKRTISINNNFFNKKMFNCLIIIPIILISITLIKETNVIAKITISYFDKGASDVTKYLDPIVKNVEDTIKENGTFSYMYVDNYEKSGFLSNIRFRYITVPNEMVNFNQVSKAFNYDSDSELKEFLCEVKVDYIIVRKSKRIEKIMGVKVPREGLIYKKNNDYCSQDLKDYFITIKEVN